MVVGAEQVDLVLEAAVALVQVVGRIGGEVRVLAVRATDHAILVVTEVGGAHPDGALLVEDMPLLAQAIDGLVDQTHTLIVLGVQGALGEPDVEVDVELRQRLLLLFELVRVGELAGDVDLFVGRQFEQVGTRSEHARREVADVASRVAALRGRLSLRRGEDGTREAVHLRTRVVDVVLPGDGGTRRGEHPGDRIAESGPARVSDVEGSGRVRAHELDVDALAHLRVVRPVRVPCVDDDLRQRTGGCSVEADVDESGARDLGARDAVDAGETVGDLLSQLTRVRAKRLGQAHGDVRRPVAVVAVAGALEHDV